MPLFVFCMVYLIGTSTYIYIYIYIYVFCIMHAGGEVWSSFESMSATLPPSSWGMNSVAASQRNHNVSAIIGAYSGEYYVV
jgi:hypothetical protein